MNRWSIRMRGGLDVRRPDGSEVSFPTRKAGALLAVLALKQGHAVPRTDLGEILWPNSPPDAQLVSLRQALRHLQISLGETTPVLARRDSCRVETLQIECPDLGDQTGILLPEMTETWFEDIRRAEGVVEPHAAADSSLAGAFHRQQKAALGLMDALEWTAVTRPRECLRIARSSLELIESAPPHRMGPVLDAALGATKSDDPLFAWGIVLRGIMNLLGGNVEAAIGQLEEARDQAVLHRDRGLFVLSSFYLTATQISSGDHAAALTTIQGAKRLRLENVDHYAAVRLRHGMGLALVHDGQFKAGLRELWIARNESEERTAPYERAYVTANLALFEATVGNPAKARLLIGDLKTLPAGDAARFELTSLTAQMYLEFLEGNRESCQLHARRVIDSATSWHTTGCDIYAYETLAVQAHRAKRSSDSNRYLASAAALRRAANYGMTNWDRHRLGTLASKLG